MFFSVAYTKIFVKQSGDSIELECEFCPWMHCSLYLVAYLSMVFTVGLQGDRTKKVGVVDSEYIFHKGIQTLGGSGHSGKKVSCISPVSLHQ